MLIPYLLWCFSQKTWDIFWCWSLPGGFVWKWGTLHSTALSSGQSKIWWSSGQSGTPFLPSIRAFFLGMSQLFQFSVHGPGQKMAQIRPMPRWRSWFRSTEPFAEGRPGGDLSPPMAAPKQVSHQWLQAAAEAVGAVCGSDVWKCWKCWKL